MAKSLVCEGATAKPRFHRRHLHRRHRGGAQRRSEPDEADTAFLWIASLPLAMTPQVRDAMSAAARSGDHQARLALRVCADERAI